MFIRFLPFLIKSIFHLTNPQKARNILQYLIKGKHFFTIKLLYNFEQKKSTKNLVLFLPGKGCWWAQKTGGCTMCGFNEKIKDLNRSYVFNDSDLLAMYRIAEILTFNEEPSSLLIYNAGSFLNDEEISPKVQTKICRRIKKHPTIQNLFVESRVEFITSSKVLSLKKELEPKKLTVAIGLESQDDKVRNLYIKKGVSKKQYEDAVKILKDNGIKVATYILIKPLYLSEKEAIKEAIKSAKYAFEKGSDEVIFEASFIQKGTLMEVLYNQKKFKPPWLWSIVEVLKKTYKWGNIQLGEFYDEPPPIAVPYNCNICSEKINKSLQIFRETNNISVFENLKDLNCECQKMWEREIKS